MVRRTRYRMIIAALTLAAIVAGFLWMMDRRFTPERPAGSPRDTIAVVLPDPDTARLPVPILPADTAAGASPIPDTVPPVALPFPDTLALPSTGETVPRSSAARRLLIPVAGITAGELVDTYSDARSEGRVHNAIDIIAPHNSPVLAATDGPIIKLFQSELGGTTIYQLGSDSMTVYYYAHLDHYAPGLLEGHMARQGEVIAYVGDTGNAGAGNYHLHFAIWLITDPKHYWDGVDINPYPILTGKVLTGKP